MQRVVPMVSGHTEGLADQSRTLAAVLRDIEAQHEAVQADVHLRTDGLANSINGALAAEENGRAELHSALERAATETQREEEARLGDFKTANVHAAEDAKAAIASAARTA